MAISHSGNRPDALRIGHIADILPTRLGCTIQNPSTLNNMLLARHALVAHGVSTASPYPWLCAKWYRLVRKTITATAAVAAERQLQGATKNAR